MTKSSNGFQWRDIFLFYLIGSFVYNPARRRLLSLSLKFTESQSKQEDTASEESAELDDKREQALNELGLLPKLRGLGKFYQVGSTVLLVLLLFQMGLILLLDPEGSLLLTKLVNCYGPKMMVHVMAARKFAPIFTLVVTVNHIVWRTLILLIEREFELQLIPFLWANEKIVRRRVELGGSRIRLSGHLDILDRSLFLAVKDRMTGAAEFKLRPNRTLEARQRMVKLIGSSLNVILTLASLLLALAVPTMLHTIFYLQDDMYAKCAWQVSTVTFILRTVVGIGATMIFFCEQMIALLVVTTLGYILALDLFVYWDSIEPRAISLHRRLADRSSTLLSEPFFEPSRRIFGQIDAAKDFSRQQLVAIGQQQVMASRETRQISDEIDDVQWMLADFFVQLKYVDNFISPVLTVAMAVWLTCNFAITWAKLQLDLNVNLGGFIIRLFQMAGFIVVVVFSALVLRLKQSTGPLYATLCSLISLDRTISRGRWIQLLDVYTDKPRYAFTILHGPIFTQTILIRILSYTLTLIVLLNTRSFF